MKNGSLDDSENWSRKGRAEKFTQLFRDPRFGLRRAFLFGKNVESKLGAQDFVFYLLEIQQTDRRPLKFVNTAGASFRGRLKNGEGSARRANVGMPNA